uniref:HEPN domain-containing protein n=1 Tax=Steinernema glaseri TaxID=37863 RepID=A0A1I7ZWM0_9BILA
MIHNVSPEELRQFTGTSSINELASRMLSDTDFSKDLLTLAISGGCIIEEPVQITNFNYSTLQHSVVDSNRNMLQPILLDSGQWKVIQVHSTSLKYNLPNTDVLTDLLSNDKLCTILLLAAIFQKCRIVKPEKCNSFSVPMEGNSNSIVCNDVLQPISDNGNEWILAKYSTYRYVRVYYTTTDYAQSDFEKLQEIGNIVKQKSNLPVHVRCTLLSPTELQDIRHSCERVDCVDLDQYQWPGTHKDDTLQEIKAESNFSAEAKYCAYRYIRLYNVNVEIGKTEFEKLKDLRAFYKKVEISAEPWKMPVYAHCERPTKPTEIGKYAVTQTMLSLHKDIDNNDVIFKELEEAQNSKWQHAITVFKQGKQFFSKVVFDLCSLLLHDYVSKEDQNAASFIEVVVFVRERIRQHYHFPDYDATGIISATTEELTAIEMDKTMEELLTTEMMERIKQTFCTDMEDYKKLRNNATQEAAINVTEWKTSVCFAAHFEKHVPFQRITKSYFGISLKGYFITRSTFKEGEAIGRYKLATEENLIKTLFDPTQQDHHHRCKKCFLKLQRFMHNADLTRLLFGKILQFHRDNDNTKLFVTYFKLNGQTCFLKMIYELMRKIDKERKKCCHKEIYEFEAIHEKSKEALDRIASTPLFVGKLFSAVPYIHYGPFVVLLSQARTFTEEEIASALGAGEWTVLNYMTSTFARSPVRIEQRINFLGCFYDPNEMQFTAGPHLCDGITKQEDDSGASFDEMLIYPFKSLSVTKHIIQMHEKIWKSHFLSQTDYEPTKLHKLRVSKVATFYNDVAATIQSDSATDDLSQKLRAAFNLKHKRAGNTRFMKLSQFEKCELLTCEMRAIREQQQKN